MVRTGPVRSTIFFPGLVVALAFIEVFLQSVIARFLSAFRAVRPRVIAQIQKAIEDLRMQTRDSQRALKVFEQGTSTAHRSIEATLAGIQQQLNALGEQQQRNLEAAHETLESLTRELDALAIREAQLRAVACANLDFIDALPDLDATLADPTAIEAHICASLDRAVMHDHPFPHMIVDDLLPLPLFDALVTGLPSAILFAGKRVNHQHLKPPFDLAPVYSRRIWGFFADTVTKDFIRPAVLTKFAGPVSAWLRENFPAADEPVAAAHMTCSDGRLLLRRRGYQIPPHRDPKWGFITSLLYLPKPGDDEQWGTQIYSVQDDAETRGAKPHWISAEQCTLVADVAFRPNRMLIFLNSIGAHGASIPEDAVPADLERYAYQFRIGPNAKSIKRLLASLPDSRQPYWAGKIDREAT